MLWARISARDLRYPKLNVGRSFVPIGLNMAHPVGAAGRKHEAMEQWVFALSFTRGNLIRIWLSQPWWNPEREAGRFDEEPARRLSGLINFCGQHIRKIDPALAHQRRALRSSYHVPQRGPQRSMDEPWASSAGRELFVGRLDWLSARFAERPEIFGRELWNEIHAARAYPANQLQWTVDMLVELRRRFPRHLAMQSLGSLDRDAALPLYRRYALLPDKRSEPPPWVEGAQVSLFEIAGRSAIRRAATYDPWGDPAQLAEMAQERLRLPAFRRWFVVRLDLADTPAVASAREVAP